MNNKCSVSKQWDGGDKYWVKKWRRDSLHKLVSPVKPDRWKGVRYLKIFKGNILQNRRAFAEYQGQESVWDLRKGVQETVQELCGVKLVSETYDTLKKRWDWHEKTCNKPKLKDILTKTLQGINVTKSRREWGIPTYWKRLRREGIRLQCGIPDLIVEKKNNNFWEKVVTFE